MTSRAQVVEEARAWVGTPWVHQAHVKQQGCDCLGLVRGVMVGVGALPPVAQWTALRVPDKYFAYSRVPDAKLLMEGFEQYWHRVPVEEARPADILILALGVSPRHVGIIVDHKHGLALVHAMQGLGRGGRVVEHRLTPELRQKAFAAFSFPGIEE